MKGNFKYGVMIEDKFQAEREQAEEIRRNIEEQQRREAETEELRAQLEKAMEELANAKAQVGFFNGKVDALTLQLTDKEAEIHTAYEQIAAEKEQSGMLAQQVRQLAHENEALTKQLEEAYAVIDRMAEAHACLQGQYAHLENTLETRERHFQNEMEGMYAYIEMLRHTNAVIAEGRAVTRTYTMVQQELKTFTAPHGAVDPAVVNEEAPPQRELDRLKAKVDSLQLKNTQLEKQLETHKEQWGILKADMDHHVNEVTCGLLPNPLDGTTQEGFASSPMQDNSELQKKIDELERAVHILTTERDQARVERSALENAMADMLTKVQNEVTKVTTNATTHVDELKEQVEALTHEKDGLHGDLEVARKEIDKIETAQCRLEKQIQSYEGAMEEMTNTLIH